MMILASYQETYFMSTAFYICDGFILSHPPFHSTLVVNNSMCLGLNVELSVMNQRKALT